MNDSPCRPEIEATVYYGTDRLVAGGSDGIESLLIHEDREKIW
jgi:hypothetical protein